MECGKQAYIENGTAGLVGCYLLQVIKNGA